MVATNPNYPPPKNPHRKEDNDGWIEWDYASSADRLPVKAGVLVDVLFRDGSVDTGLAGGFLWARHWIGSDIISYRISQSSGNAIDQPSFVSLSAPILLHRAAELMEERGKQYDKPEGERSMGKCVTAFNVITGQNLSEAEGWLLLQILKDVRLWQRAGYHQDSAEDCIAYAALKAEAKQAEEKP